MKALWILVIFFFSLPIFAFTGSYSGTGKAVFSSGKVYECYEIFLRLETKPNLFRMKEGGYRCGDILNASFDPFKLIIKDGQLFYHDQILGMISENKLSYKIFDPEDGSTYHLRLIKHSHQIEYFEEWHDGEKIALTVTGKLKEQEPIFR